MITIIAWFVSGPLGGIVFGWIALGRIDRRGGRGRAQIIAILSISYAIVIIATALFTLKLISSYGGTLSAPD
ncbi:hypothetical protein QCD70_15275 [Agreia sp. PsM10]|uniref:hypothetical protein n=1 Tax=Agreia sp. PsM10 TaxID=3030533 RepID=UPI00263AD23D|nr:hypothetical protein [Agreia sp. PsM10]MDN4641613.1 hypothetical protein [Agreia sp. PsM10]